MDTKTESHGKTSLTEYQTQDSVTEGQKSANVHRIDSAGRQRGRRKKRSAGRRREKSAGRRESAGASQQTPIRKRNSVRGNGSAGRRPRSGSARRRPKSGSAATQPEPAINILPDDHVYQFVAYQTSLPFEAFNVSYSREAKKATTRSKGEKYGDVSEMPLSELWVGYDKGSFAFIAKKKFRSYARFVAENPVAPWGTYKIPGTITSGVHAGPFQLVDEQPPQRLDEKMFCYIPSQQVQIIALLKLRDDKADIPYAVATRAGRQRFRKALRGILDRLFESKDFTIDKSLSYISIETNPEHRIVDGVLEVLCEDKTLSLGESKSEVGQLVLKHVMMYVLESDLSRYLVPNSAHALVEGGCTSIGLHRIRSLMPAEAQRKSMLAARKQRSDNLSAIPLNVLKVMPKFERLIEAKHNFDLKGERKALDALSVAVREADVDTPLHVKNTNNRLLGKEFASLEGLGRLLARTHPAYAQPLQQHALRIAQERMGSGLLSRPKIHLPLPSLYSVYHPKVNR